MIRYDKSLPILSAILLLVCGSCQNKFDINTDSDKLFLPIPASHSKIDFQNNVKQTRENNHIVNVEFISGGGVAVGDINNDGLEDSRNRSDSPPPPPSPTSTHSASSTLSSSSRSEKLPPECSIQPV